MARVAFGKYVYLVGTGQSVVAPGFSPESAALKGGATVIVIPSARECNCCRRRARCPVSGTPFRSRHGQPNGNPPSWKFARHPTQRVF